MYDYCLAVQIVVRVGFEPTHERLGLLTLVFEIISSCGTCT